MQEKIPSYRHSLYYTAPRQVEVCQEDLPELGPGKVLVQTNLSAISPGTEMLVYRGEFPQDIPVDETIDALTSQFAYPLKYGYSLVGEVIALGQGVDPIWMGRRVFAFHPHESHFVSEPAALMPVPDDLSSEQAVLLPNMETAVSLIMDGAPRIGENVIVFGQGIVGLLTTRLLTQFPLSNLITLDQHPLRRQTSRQIGANTSLEPDASKPRAQILELMPAGADLTYELSGSPAALNQAIQVTGYAGRVVIGSWYGEKKASLDLGGYFHRSRIRLISSQVSRLAPELSGRWSKERRFDLVWQYLGTIEATQFITHRIPFQQADRAYRLIDQKPGESIQVLLTY
jgi:2-desacetyl-2-hydroxyethyl bacteriochlorophyllide A dehydrogenase